MRAVIVRPDREAHFGRVDVLAVNALRIRRTAVHLLEARLGDLDLVVGHLALDARRGVEAPHDAGRRPGRRLDVPDAPPERIHRRARLPRQRRRVLRPRGRVHRWCFGGQACDFRHAFRVGRQAPVLPLQVHPPRGRLGVREAGDAVFVIPGGVLRVALDIGEVEVLVPRNLLDAREGVPEPDLFHAVRDRRRLQPAPRLQRAAKAVARRERERDEADFRRVLLRRKRHVKGDVEETQLGIERHAVDGRRREIDGEGLSPVRDGTGGERPERERLLPVRHGARHALFAVARRHDARMARIGKPGQFARFERQGVDERQRAVFARRRAFQTNAMAHRTGAVPRLRLHGLHAVADARAERRKACVPADVAQEKALLAQPRVRLNEDAVEARAAFGMDFLKRWTAEPHDAGRPAKERVGRQPPDRLAVQRQRLPRPAGGRVGAERRPQGPLRRAVHVVDVGEQLEVPAARRLLGPALGRQPHGRGDRLVQGQRPAQTARALRIGVRADGRLAVARKACSERLRRRHRNPVVPYPRARAGQGEAFAPQLRHEPAGHKYRACDHRVK